MDPDWAFFDRVISTAARFCRAIGRTVRATTRLFDYWPAPRNSKQLRLAVKDNIDMKGVVTSAGSEYIIKKQSARRNGCGMPRDRPPTKRADRRERQTSVNLRWLLPA